MRLISLKNPAQKGVEAGKEHSSLNSKVFGQDRKIGRDIGVKLELRDMRPKLQSTL